VPFCHGIGPPVVRGPPWPSAKPGCTSFKKHRETFIKRGPLIQCHKIGCPRLEHLLNFTLRYGYSLWYDIIFVDNINVLDLALWAEKILKLNVFLYDLKKCIHCGSISAVGAYSALPDPLAVFKEGYF